MQVIILCDYSDKHTESFRYRQRLVDQTDGIAEPIVIKSRLDPGTR